MSDETEFYCFIFITLLCFAAFLKIKYESASWMIAEIDNTRAKVPLPEYALLKASVLPFPKGASFSFSLPLSLALRW